MSFGLRRCFEGPKDLKMEKEKEKESNDWRVSNITCFYWYEVRGCRATPVAPSFMLYL